jgi:hypothetical protein
MEESGMGILPMRLGKMNKLLFSSIRSATQPLARAFERTDLQPTP